MGITKGVEVCSLEFSVVSGAPAIAYINSTGSSRDGVLATLDGSGVLVASCTGTLGDFTSIVR